MMPSNYDPQNVGCFLFYRKLFSDLFDKMFKIECLPILLMFTFALTQMTGAKKVGKHQVPPPLYNPIANCNIA